MLWFFCGICMIFRNIFFMWIILKEVSWATHTHFASSCNENVSDMRDGFEPLFFLYCMYKIASSRIFKFLRFFFCMRQINWLFIIFKVWLCHSIVLRWITVGMYFSFISMFFLCVCFFYSIMFWWVITHPTSGGVRL